jgi:hypothetical protein
VDLLHDRYGDRLAELVPDDAEIRWHEAGQAADGVKIVLPGEGYHADVDEAASQILQTCIGWLELLTAEPLVDLAPTVRRADRGG